MQQLLLINYLMPRFSSLLNLFQQMACIEFKLTELRGIVKKIGASKIKNLFYKISMRLETISIFSFRNYLIDRVACNDRELYNIFEHFDHHRAGQITLSDFTKQLEGLKIKKKTTVLFCQQKKQIEDLLINYIQIITKGCRVLDIWRNQLQASGVLFYQLFQQINLSRTGVISPKQIHSFLIKNNRFLCTQKLKYLVKYLLKRNHKEINLELFCQNLHPLQFGEYPAYHLKRLQIIKQQELALQANLYRQAEMNKILYQQQNEQLIRFQIRKQAQIKRQYELENRIQQEILINQKLKDQILKNNQIDLNQYNLRQQKLKAQNKENQIQQQIQSNRKMLSYRQKMKDVDILNRIQRFRSQSKGNQLHLEYTTPRARQFEKQVRFNRMILANQCNALRIKREVENELCKQERILSTYR